MYSVPIGREKWEGMVDGLEITEGTTVNIGRCDLRGGGPWPRSIISLLFERCLVDYA